MNNTKSEITLPAYYDALEWHERISVRQEYIKRQDGFCWHCKSLLKNPPPNSITGKKINWNSFPKNFLKHPIHLHHSHESGLTIGAVHSYCNAVLWQYYGE